MRTKTYRHCPDCHGMGVVPDGTYCPICKGRGGYMIVVDSGEGLRIQVDLTEVDGEADIDSIPTAEGIGE